MRTLLYTILFILAASMAQASGTIVLVVDISSSLNREMLDHHYNSYASVLRSMPYLEDVNIEVVLFHDEVSHVSSGTALAAAAVFDELPRTTSLERGLTCLNNALEYVEMLVPSLPQPVIVDISGDGDANCEDDVRNGQYTNLYDTLDRLENEGTTVNTLFLVTGYPFSEILENDNIDLSLFTSQINFYESLVRGGGFSIVAEGAMHFEAALFNKISLELAQLQ